jgi:sugar O-acyltransferase (sialic acid O-acetyltransferase NeuD family)
MPEIFVIGAGGHAKVVLAALIEQGCGVNGVLDDNQALHGTELLGVPVVGGTQLLENSSDVRAVIAIGSNNVRRAIAIRFPNMAWLTAVHPTAWVAPTARLEAGTVVCAGAVIQPDARVGAHCIVNTMASVDHDCVLEDFVHLAPGVRLAGGVWVEEGVLLGVSAAAIPAVRVGAWSVVGAGSTVVRNIPPSSVSFGSPARVHRKVAS